jgi:hypothetical protein
LPSRGVLEGRDSLSVFFLTVADSPVPQIGFLPDSMSATSSGEPCCIGASYRTANIDDAQGGMGDGGSGGEDGEEGRTRVEGPGLQCEGSGRPVGLWRGAAVELLEICDCAGGATIHMGFGGGKPVGLDVLCSG